MRFLEGLSVPVTEEQTSWPHRKALLAKTIAEADADVVEAVGDAAQQQRLIGRERGRAHRSSDPTTTTKPLGSGLGSVPWP